FSSVSLRASPSSFSSRPRRFNLLSHPPFSHPSSSTLFKVSLILFSFNSSRRCISLPLFSWLWELHLPPLSLATAPLSMPPATQEELVPPSAVGSINPSSFHTH